MSPAERVCQCSYTLLGIGHGNVGTWVWGGGGDVICDARTFQEGGTGWGMMARGQVSVTG